MALTKGAKQFQPCLMQSSLQALCACHMKVYYHEHSCVYVCVPVCGDISEDCEGFELTDF